MVSAVMPDIIRPKFRYDHEDVFIQFIGFIVCTLMLGDWGALSRMRYVALFSIAGLILLIRKIGLTRDDIKLYFKFIICDVGVLMSAALYQDTQLLSYHVGLILCVFPFVQLLIVRYNLSRGTLFALAICALPAFFPQYFAGGGNISRNIVSTLNTGVRFTGLSGDPNYTVLALVIPLVGTLFLSQYKATYIKSYWMLSYIVIFSACLMTGSRAGIGSAVVVSVLYFFCQSKSVSGKNLLLIFSLVLILGIIVKFVLYDYFIFFQQRTGGTASSYFKDSRYEVWYQALLIIVESSPINRYDQDNLIRAYGFVVHNVILDIGLTFGSYTMVIHLFVITFGGYSVFRRFRTLNKYGIAFHENIYALIGLVSIAFLLVAGTLTVGMDSKYWFVYSLLFVGGFSKRIEKEKM